MPAAAEGGDEGDRPCVCQHGCAFAVRGSMKRELSVCRDVGGKRRRPNRKYDSRRGRLTIRCAQHGPLGHPERLRDFDA